MLHVLNKECVQYLSTFLSGFDLFHLLLVDKWCNRMFSDKHIWYHVGFVLNKLFHEMECTMFMTPARFCRLVLWFPLHWSLRQQYDHMAYLVEQSQEGTPEGKVLDALSDCNGLLNTSFFGIVNNIRYRYYLRLHANNSIVHWVMGKQVVFSRAKVQLQDPVAWVTSNGEWQMCSMTLEQLLKQYHCVISGL